MFEVIPVVGAKGSDGKINTRHDRDYYVKLLERKNTEYPSTLRYWEKRARLEELEEALRFSVKSINVKFVSIGDLLSTIDTESVFDSVYDNNGIYAKDIYRYAFLRFGLKKTSTFNLIGIARTFANSGKLLKQWEAYSYSQLCEMLSMSDEERKKVTPDMTIKQIRELKNVLAKGNEIPTSEYEVEDDVDEVSVQTSEPCAIDKLAALLQEGYDEHFFFNGDKNFESLACWLIEKGVRL